jgi:CHAT domain-containing protein
MNIKFSKSILTALIVFLGATATLSLNFRFFFPSNQILLQESGNLSREDNQLQQGSFFDVFSFSGKANQSITLILKSSDFSPNLILTDSQGNIIQNKGNLAYVSRITTTLPGNGSYKIVVSSSTLSTIGQYSLTVRKTKQIDLKIVEIDRQFERGWKKYHSGQTFEGVQEIKQALNFYRQLGDVDGELRCLGFLGSGLALGIEIKESIEYQKQRLALAKQTNNRSQEAIALGMIGNLYRVQGKYSEALNYYQQSFKVHEQIGNLKGQAGVYGVLGVIHGDLGQRQKEIDYLQKALEIYRKINDSQGEANARTSLASHYVSLGKYQEAIDYCQEAINIDPTRITASLTCSQVFSLAYSARGQYEEGIKYLEQNLGLAIKINDRVDGAFILLNLAGIYLKLGQDQKAIAYCQESQAIAKELNAPILEAFSLNNLGVLYILQERYTEARNVLLEAIRIYESLRPGLSDAAKISLFDTQANSYRLLQYTLIAQNQINTALEISERGRARAFVELLAAKISDKPQAQVKPLTLQQIQQIAKQQKATLIEYSIIPNIKPSESSVLYIWVIKPSGEIAFKQVDFQLPVKLDLNKPETFNRGLQEWVANTRSSIGVDSRSTSQKLPYRPGDLVKLKDDAELDFTQPWKVIAFDSTTETLTLTNPDYNKEQETQERPVSDVKEKVESYSDIKKNLQQLYRQLIAPIESDLPTNPEERIIFIPQGELFLIPFAALQNSQGKYLIEKHNILTAPSIQVLEFTRQNKNTLAKEGTSALVVGNPTMPIIPLSDPPEPLRSLPNTEIEAKKIAKLLGTTPILGSQATKNQIVQQMPKAKVIHLATHGLLADIKQLGVPGAIALAPTANDNGFLTSGELIDMKLNADLVVLSACNTGGGKITGDGVIGLSRSLVSAGTSSVIVSLWSVPDAPTAELMTQFYQNYLMRGMNKAQALRSAMLTMLKKHDNPVDWAAFTLIGEAE